VAKLLQDYPEIVIELISHTDSRGDDEPNQILSVNRARACYKYLVEALNVDPRRIIPLGKGELEPATWRNPATGEKIVLTEEYINTFKENSTLYEQLNQLNRRTEGRIIRKDFDPKTYPEASKEYLEFIITPK
jgi:outer membrane protein OmpA-like peptidoglycan-associated protein